jgi:ATP-dependent DNA helicase RecG
MTTGWYGRLVDEGPLIVDQPARIALVDRLRAEPREAATFEFKLNWDRPLDIGQYLSALGNAAVLARRDQAWLVWGVDDKTHEVKGTTFDPFSARGEGNQPLVMWLTQKTSPRADFEFHEVQHPGGRVVLMTIQAPRTAPLAFDGVRYIRVDSHKTRLSDHPDKEHRIWSLLGQQSDWTGELVPDATLDDLEPAAVDAARMRFIEYLLKAEPDSSRHEQIKAQAQDWDVPTLLNKALDSADRGHPRVEVAIPGQVLDVKYSQLLMKRIDLQLRQVFLLDRVQKKKSLQPSEMQELRTMKLIEGRSPNLYVSAKVADWTHQKAAYIRNRGLDDGYYRTLVTDYLTQYGQANRRELDELLLDKLLEVLDASQKTSKVRNLLQAMRREGLIHRVGPKVTAIWLPGAGKSEIQS